MDTSDKKGYDTVFQITNLKKEIEKLQSENLYYGKYKEELSKRVSMTNARDNYKKRLLEVEKQLKNVKSENKNFKKQLSDEKKDKQAIINRSNKASDKKDEIIKKLREEIKTLKADNEELGKENKTLKNLVSITKNITQKDPNNSSIPTSKSFTKRKKVCNSRKSTGKSVGGQFGHKGNKIKKSNTPNNVINIYLSKDTPDYSNYVQTGKYKTKQKVEIKLITEITEYREYEYRNIVTGETIWSKNDEGINSPFVYDSSVKALAVLLNNYGNVSVNKTKKILKELSKGAITLSEGSIENFKKEFNKKSDKELDQIINDITKERIINVDHTSINVNGEYYYVIFTGNDGKALYQLYPKKDLESMEILEKCIVDVLVHDHDKSFYNFGKLHQECCAHILRKLVFCKDTFKYEWADKLKTLLESTIHKRNVDIANNITVYPKEYIDGVNKEFRNIVETGKKEIEGIEKNMYNKDGHNLLKMVDDYQNCILLFLTDFDVPATNNISENHLRSIKAKQNVSHQFKNEEAAKNYVAFLTLIKNWLKSDIDLYSKIQGIFELKY